GAVVAEHAGGAGDEAAAAGLGGQVDVVDGAGVTLVDVGPVVLAELGGDAVHAPTLFERLQRRRAGDVVEVAAHEHERVGVAGDREVDEGARGGGLGEAALGVVAVLRLEVRGEGDQAPAGGVE